MSSEDDYSARRAVPEHPRLFARWRSRSALVRSQLQCKLDEPYGPNDAQRVDIFYSTVPAEGCVIFLHGGYWQSLDKTYFSFIAPPLCAAGIHVLIAGYSLAPTATLDMIEDDVVCLLGSSVLSSLSSTTEPHLSLWGHSAGAQLATVALSARGGQHCRNIESVLGISGLYDLRPLVATSMNSALGLTDDLAADHSPMFNTPIASLKRALFAVGSDESAAFHWQTDQMYRNWSRSVPQCETLEIARSNHFTILDRMIVDKRFLGAILCLVKGYSHDF